MFQKTNANQLNISAYVLRVELPDLCRKPRNQLAHAKPLTILDGKQKNGCISCQTGSHCYVITNAQMFVIIQYLACHGPRQRNMRSYCSWKTFYEFSAIWFIIENKWALVGNRLIQRIPDTDCYNKAKLGQLLLFFYGCCLHYLGCHASVTWEASWRIFLWFLWHPFAVVRYVAQYRYLEKIFVMVYLISTLTAIYYCWKQS